MVVPIGINGNSNYWIPDSAIVGGMSVPGNVWSYDFSCMYPQDGISTLNDSALYSFDFATNNLVNQVAALNSKWMPLLNKYMADVSQWYQNTMLNISSNTNYNINPFGPINTVNNPGNTNGTGNTNNSYADKIKETDVSTFMKRLFNDPRLKDSFEFNYKFQLEDGTQVTLMEKLNELIKDYLNNKGSGAILSDEEFMKIREIAGKYAKTGDITADDFATLKSIVEAHLEKKEEDDDPNPPKDPETPATTARPVAYQEGHASQDVSGVAQLSFNAMDGMGTNKNKLNQSILEIDKHTVIEFLDEYEKIDNNGDTWIRKFWGDFDHWDRSGESWNPFGHDNARASKLPLMVGYLKDRATDIKNLPNCTDKTKEALDKAVTAMEGAVNAMDAKIDVDSNLGERDEEGSLKNNFIVAFDGLKDAIKAAEEQVYGREP